MPNRSFPDRVVVSMPLSSSTRSPGPLHGEAVDDLVQVRCRARQSVELRHHQHITFPDLVENPGQRWSVPVEPGQLLLVNLLTAVGLEPFYLGRVVLADRADAGISNEHA